MNKKIFENTRKLVVHSDGGSDQVCSKLSNFRVFVANAVTVTTTPRLNWLKKNQFIGVGERCGLKIKNTKLNNWLSKGDRREIQPTWNDDTHIVTITTKLHLTRKHCSKTKWITLVLLESELRLARLQRKKERPPKQRKVSL